MKDEIPEFSRLLDACGTSKTELAIALGIHRTTIYEWRNAAPKYALAYLRERKKVLDLQKDVATLRGALSLMRKEQ